MRALADRSERVSVITFNYDIGIDFGLWTRGLEIDYAFLPDS